MAFVIGVFGGIVLKLLEVSPFITAGYSAGVLVTYATLAYLSTSLRLEPEVIGDNSYYLGFLFTLTSLSVTLYFVVEARVADRAQLIPEVISGFGVALVSTIVGVFIRVMMMQFRFDVVAREREVRVEIDDAMRRLRTEMTNALQQMKAFGVESMQHAAEREAKFAKTTDMLVDGVQTTFSEMYKVFNTELNKTVQEQSVAAVEVIRASVQGTAEAALRQLAVAFEDIGKSAHGLSATQATSRSVNDQANAALILQVNTLTELVSQMSRRLRSVSEEVETSGAALSRSISEAATRLDRSLTDTTRKLDDTLKSFQAASETAANRTEHVIDKTNPSATSPDVASPVVAKDQVPESATLAPGNWLGSWTRNPPKSDRGNK